MRRVPIVREKQVTQWPEYDRLEDGLRNYWYPVMLARRLRGKVPARIFGEGVLLVRDGGEVFALADRCPHRGTPMRFAKRDFPGTLSCIYHGWCFDLKTGNLVAALTDGPDCPLVGEVAIKTYPVEERFGLIWIYMGTGTPRPLEQDVPEDFLDPRTVRCIRITEQDGNWRFAVENHFDDSHAHYLHRSSLYSTFVKEPSYKPASNRMNERLGREAGTGAAHRARWRLAGARAGLAAFRRRLSRPRPLAAVPVLAAAVVPRQGVRAHARNRRWWSARRIPPPAPYPLHLRPLPVRPG